MSYIELKQHYPWLFPVAVFFLAMIVILLVLVVASALINRQHQKRLQALASHVFPDRYYKEVTQMYPQLSIESVQMAFEQLRLYFRVCLIKQPKRVAMPSRLVDVCWHCFICDTRQYQRFCDDVFDDFLHHEALVDTSFSIPSASSELSKPEEEADLSEKAKAQRDIEFQNQLVAARIYQWSAELEVKSKRQNPIATDVPLLFKIDEALGIGDGFHYPLEITQFLESFDLKAAEGAEDMRNVEGTSGTAAACGDGGSAATCGGCGGST
jgi:hypothetical protein